MKIRIAKNAGFCFGVKRAVEITEKALKESRKKLYCMGSLIHNPQVVETLEKKGLITVDNVNRVPSCSRFLIRSHGLPPVVMEKLRRKNVEIIDATCPFVKKAQLTAKNFYEAGFQVVICGDPDHAEVVAINAQIENKGIIVSNPRLDCKKIDYNKKIGLLSQTTQNVKLLRQVADSSLSNCARTISIVNTICLDSTSKQTEIYTLAKKSDVVIVIGGKKSSNTNKLVQISQSSCAKTFHIETSAEIKTKWFRDAKIVGIAAGASTAKYLIDETVDELKRINLCRHKLSS